MKKRINLYTMLVTAVTGLVITGCVKEKGFEPGTAIRFSAISSGLETRTVYGETGSETIGGVTKSVQYIDWEEGDGMMILMKHGDDYFHKNYLVDELLTSETNEGESTAIIEPDNTDTNPDLVWKGQDTHTFYAMYPAGSYDANSNVLRGTIPSSQAPSASMEHGYMFTDIPVEKPVAAYKNVDEINLYFNPHFTAFQFTLDNKTGDDITISAFSLTSSLSGAALTGTIAYDVATATVSTTPASSDAKVISISSGFAIEGGTAKVIVFTALPNTFASGTLTVSCTADGVTKNFTLASAFAANKKHNLSVKWESDDYIITVDSPEVTSYGTSITAAVSSYKEPKGSTVSGDETPVAWAVKGFYNSVTDAANTTIANNTSCPTWLTINSSTQTSINYTVAAPSGNGSAITSNIQTSINTSIASRSCGTNENPVNLANPSNIGANPSTYIAESANCYIVNHPGFYKIPLVMGNGVKANSLAAEAVFKGNTTNTNTDNLVRFYDYNGVGIDSPILNASDITQSSIIWEDGAIVSNLDFITTTSTVESQAVKWLKFEVTATCQGNAVIAVKNSSSNVMWSYHIWVTDLVPGQAILLKSNVYSTPYPLGWVTTSGSGTKWNGQSTFVRLRQGDNGKIAVLKIQGPDVYSSTQPGGYCTYYEWARKDPMIPNNTDTSIPKCTLSTSHEEEISSLQILSMSGTYSSSNYKTSILNPGKFIYNKDGAGNWWGGKVYPKNLWNANSTSYGNSVSSVTKTIFDPCPAGYSVPGSDSYTGVNLVSKFTNVKYRQGTQYVTTAGQLTGTTHFWSAIPNENFQAFSFSLVSESVSTYTDQRHGHCILPMKNSN